jgi:hypothetical protein
MPLRYTALKAFLAFSILKIWNLNEHSGVIGAFNCQGAGWCRLGKKNLVHDEQPGTVTGVVRAQDVDYLAKVADHSWNGDVILYSHIGGKHHASWISQLNCVFYFILTSFTR